MLFALVIKLMHLDNVLLDRKGHIKLADFGSCLRMQEDDTIRSSVSVGTPDYISPEILQANEDGQGRYGKECDWWSLGVCIYEMLYGETPFYAESLVETYGKIMSHKDRLFFPIYEDLHVSDHTQSLIRALICDKKDRLGQRGIAEFKDHPFFTGMDWENIHNIEAPQIPDVSSETDTSNFDCDDLEEERVETTAPRLGNATFCGKNLPFVGFSFNRDSKLSDVGMLTLDKAATGAGGKANTANDKVINGLKAEVEGLMAKLQLKDEQADVNKEFESALMTVRNEKDDLNKQIELLEGKLAALNGELAQRDDVLLSVKGKEEQARQEINQKDQEIQRGVLKIDHLENDTRIMTGKIEQLRSDCRQQEKTKKDLAEQLRFQEQRNENDQERINELQQQLEAASNEQLSSKKNSQEVHRLRGELEEVRAKSAQSQLDQQQERAREKRELEEKCADVEHRLDQAMKGHEQEVRELRTEFEIKNMELRQLQDKAAAVENENERFHRSLVEAHQKLAANTENTTNTNEQWEVQLSNLTRWVEDERAARSYLETMATQLNHELQLLKEQPTLTSSMPNGGQKSDWKTLRQTKKKDQQLLELQSTLQEELNRREDMYKEIVAEKNRIQMLEQELMEKEVIIQELRNNKHQDNHQTSPYYSQNQYDESDTVSGRSTPETKPLIGRQTDKELYNIPARNPIKLEKTHLFVVRTFSEPTQCAICYSFMLGLWRQGVICQECELPCHIHCAKSADQTCPAPNYRPTDRAPIVGAETLNLPQEQGLAMRETIFLPKPKGVKKGWIKHVGAISQNRFLVFPFSEKRGLSDKVSSIELLFIF